MTQEDKELLLKDLCARLPYEVKATWDGKHSLTVTPYIYCAIASEDNIDNLPKLLLRPMSSMTEEEKRKFSIFIGKTEIYRQQICLDSDSMCNPTIGGYKCVYWGLFDKCIDWLNAHHFDYRGLIEKGIALEAPEGMYNI